MRLSIPLPASTEIASSSLCEPPHVESSTTRFKRLTPVDQRDATFVAMLPAFRTTGGIATGEEIKQRIGQRQTGGSSRLARSIAAGELISFEWNATLWLPLCQFDLYTMEMDRGAEEIVQELASIMDGWEITQWLATPHPALHDKLPVDLLRTNRGATLNAARLDRFIARG